MKKGAIVFKSDGKLARRFDTGKKSAWYNSISQSIVVDINIIDNALYVYFQDDSMFVFCNVPFEYFEMPEEEE